MLSNDEENSSHIISMVHDKNRELSNRVPKIVESIDFKHIPSRKEECTGTGTETSTSNIASKMTSSIDFFEEKNDIVKNEATGHNFAKQKNDLDDVISMATSTDTLKFSNARREGQSISHVSKQTPNLISYNLNCPIQEYRVEKSNKNMLKKTGKAIQRIWSRPQISKNYSLGQNSRPGMKQKHCSSFQKPLTAATKNYKSSTLLQKKNMHPRHKSEDLSKSSSAQINSMDNAIRGRLDGLDIISVGSARNVSFVSPEQARNAGQRYTLRSMISDSLTYGNTTNVMIVLEGYLSNERWSVCVEELPSGMDDDKKRSKDKVQMKNNNSSSGSFSDGTEISAEIPTHSLLNQMWGKDNVPPPTSNLMQFDKHREITDYFIAANCPIDVDENVVIIDSIERLQNVIDIAASSIRSGCFEEAIEIFGKILESLSTQEDSRKRQMPRKQTLIGSTYHNIATLQMWAGLYEDALLSLNDAIDIRVKAFSEYHPLVAVSYYKLGLVQFSLEQLDSALQSFEQVIKIQHLINSPDLQTAKVFCNIGVTLYHKGDLLSASKFLRQSLEIQRKWIGIPVRRECNVYEFSVTLCNMGKIFLERNDYEMSFHAYEEALTLQKMSFKKDHNIVLLSLGNIAFTKAKRGEKSKALQIYKEIYIAQIKKFGAESREVAETVGLMSVIYIQQGNYQEAIKCLHHVLHWQMANLDEHHLAILNTKRTIEKMSHEISGTG